MWKIDSTPSSTRTWSVNAVICSRVWAERRTAIIACSPYPIAAGSTSAWKPRRMPRRRSARTRSRQVDGATPASSASRELGIRASSRRTPTIVRSTASIPGMNRRIGDEATFYRTSFGLLKVRPKECDNGSMTSATSVTTTADIKDSILDAVGNTPLVRVSRLAAGLTPQVLAKVEALNPGGSIKDRAALAMIDAAERSGELQLGGTIVEPTSGNTGTGLAIASRLKGYRVIAVMPDKMSREKIDLLRAYGAEVVVTPTDVDPESPQSYYRVADRLEREIPGAFQPNQYKNPANPEAH